MGKLDSLRFRFGLLVVMIAISGLSQGMLTPLIAVIFEQNGISSSVNGLHATAIYIGMLLTAPFLEAPLRKIGYKPIIQIGGIIVILSLTLFPLWDSLWFWFILRLFIGIGDNFLHFGTQTWITASSPINKRGRNISLYGLFFGIGFAVGPMMTNLIKISPALPFIISSSLSLLVWLPIYLIKNEFPEKGKEKSTFLGTLQRFKNAWKFGWIAFLFPFCYGFMEASLNGSFPIAALRNGLELHEVSIILPAFAIGSIIFQLPLGMISDLHGRRKTLMIALMIGIFSFTIAGFSQDSVLGLIVCIFIAGMFLGSTFSLGISYMTDLVPRNLLPAGNIMCSILYSIGSMCGPFMGGLVIQYLKGISFFFMISFMLVTILIALFSFKPKKDQLLFRQHIS